MDKLYVIHNLFISGQLIARTPLIFEWFKDSDSQGHHPLKQQYMIKEKMQLAQPFHSLFALLNISSTV